MTRKLNVGLVLLGILPSLGYSSGWENLAIPHLENIRLESCSEALIHHVRGPNFSTETRAKLAESLPLEGEVYVIQASKQESGFRNLARDSQQYLGKGIERLPEYWVSSGLTTWAVYAGKAQFWKRFATTPKPFHEPEFQIIPVLDALHTHITKSFHPELRQIRDRGANVEYVRQRLGHYLGKSVQTPTDVRDALVKMVEVEVPEDKKVEIQKRILLELPFDNAISLSIFNDAKIQFQIRTALFWIAESLHHELELDYLFESEVRVLGRSDKSSRP